MWPLERGQEAPIVYVEMYNAWVAVAIWSRLWKNRIVKINSDNLAVVHFINTLRTNDGFLSMCLRNILMILAKNNVHIQAERIMGIDNNKAEALSR